VHVGRYPGLDVVASLPAGKDTFLLGRHRSKDVWLYDTPAKRRLTSDGENFSAAISRDGELLLGKRAPDGSFAIWRYGRDGSKKRVSNGPSDVRPDFSPDGRSWAYVDYEQKSIMICRIGDDRCRVLCKDEMLPTWPRFSPDGESLAYVTQLKTQRLVIVSLKDGKSRQLGAALSQCPPVWSSAARVWAFDGSTKQYAWSERNAATGAKTGGRLEMQETTNDANEQADEDMCWPVGQRPGSPFFPRLRIEVEETSHLLHLPAESKI
jgi:Tol biopolymer transport system component